MFLSGILVLKNISLKLFQSDIQSMSQQSLYPGLNPNQIQMFPGLNHNMPPGYPPYGGNLL